MSPRQYEIERVFARLPAYNPFVGTFHHAPSAGNRGAVYFSSDIVDLEEWEERKRLRQHPLTGTFHALPGYYDPLHGLVQFRSECQEYLDKKESTHKEEEGKEDTGDPPLSSSSSTSTSSSSSFEMNDKIHHTTPILARFASEKSALLLDTPEKTCRRSRRNSAPVGYVFRFKPIETLYSESDRNSSSHRSKTASLSPRSLQLLMRSFGPCTLDNQELKRARSEEGYVSTGRGLFQHSISCSSPLSKTVEEPQEREGSIGEYCQGAHCAVGNHPVANPFIARRLRDSTGDLRIITLDRGAPRSIYDEPSRTISGSRASSYSIDEDEGRPKPYFIHETAITEQYDILGNDQLGDGSYGVVRPAVSRSLGREVAIKQVHKAYLRSHEARKAVKREVEIHLRLEHRNIIRLHEVYETDDFLYLVMDKATKGTVKDVLNLRRRIPEATACRWAQQLLRAVYYMHEHGVVHCDIKPDNILLKEKSKRSLNGTSSTTISTLDSNEVPPTSDTSAWSQWNVSVCDFGLAVKVPDVRYFKLTGDVHKVPYQGVTGTSTYMAPEIMEQRAYGISADMWSVGVVLFELLAGYTPFYPASACLSERVDFSDRMWKQVSPASRDLVSVLLNNDPSKRLTAEQALSHAWFENAPLLRT